MDLSPFEDGLNDIIHTKISEIMAYMDRLDERKQMWMEAITRTKKRGELDAFSVYFWSFWVELEYGNYYICQKWLQYWLGLFEKNSGKKFEATTETKSRLEAEAEVQRAKQVPIENFYQGKLRGAGARQMGLCPFHEESSPSFFIFTNTNTFHCFGCAAGNDVIDFIMKLKKLTFSQAVQFLL